MFKKILLISSFYVILWSAQAGAQQANKNKIFLTTLRPCSLAGQANNEMKYKSEEVSYFAIVASQLYNKLAIFDADFGTLKFSFSEDEAKFERIHQGFWSSDVWYEFANFDLSAASLSEGTSDNHTLARKYKQSILDRIEQIEDQLESITQNMGETQKQGTKGILECAKIVLTTVFERP